MDTHMLTSPVRVLQKFRQIENEVDSFRSNVSGSIPYVCTAKTALLRLTKAQWQVRITLSSMLLICFNICTRLIPMFKSASFKPLYEWETGQAPDPSLCGFVFQEGNGMLHSSRLFLSLSLKDKRDLPTDLLARSWPKSVIAQRRKVSCPPVGFFENGFNTGHFAFNQRFTF